MVHVTKYFQILPQQLLVYCVLIKIPHSCCCLPGSDWLSLVSEVGTKVSTESQVLVLAAMTLGTTN